VLRDVLSPSKIQVAKGSDISNFERLPEKSRMGNRLDDFRQPRRAASWVADNKYRCPRIKMRCVRNPAPLIILPYHVKLKYGLPGEIKQHDVEKPEALVCFAIKVYVSRAYDSVG
jgi:hypothetical protein